MNSYSVAVSFDLDRAEDRAALTWLSQCRRDGFKTYSAAVVAAVNEYRDRRERLAADPYLEAREKEDAFLRRVLDTIRQGMEESAAGNLGGLFRFLQACQTSGGAVEGTASGDRNQSNTEDLESIRMALDFTDAL